jgi:predicted nuclease with TOPRIM domain
MVDCTTRAGQGTCSQQPINEIIEVREFAINAAEDLFNKFSNSEIREFLEELKKYCLDRLHDQLEKARNEHQRLDDDFVKLQKEI